MQFLFSLLLFVLGLGLIIYCAEQLVKGAIGTSLRFGMSTFLVSVIFISFDPENLFLGAVASYEQAAGLALGSIIGATMVAIALAFGITHGVRKSAQKNYCCARVRGFAVGRLESGWSAQSN